MKLTITVYERNKVYARALQEFGNDATILVIEKHYTVSEGTVFFYKVYSNSKVYRRTIHLSEL